MLKALIAGIVVGVAGIASWFYRKEIQQHATTGYEKAKGLVDKYTTKK